MMCAAHREAYLGKHIRKWNFDLQMEEDKNMHKIVQTNLRPASLLSVVLSGIQKVV